MEATGQMSGGYLIYLVETVSVEDYDRTAAEGRAGAAEKELKEYKETFSETTDNLNAEKEALEELLEQERDAGRNYRRKLDEGGTGKRRTLQGPYRVPPDLRRVTARNRKIIERQRRRKRPWLHLHNLEKSQKAFREF